MVKVTINKIQIEMDFETLGKLIRSGAFASVADIIVETQTVIWKWNKSTDGPINSMFICMGLKK